MIVLADSVRASTHLNHQVPMLIVMKNFALIVKDETIRFNSWFLSNKIQVEEIY